MEKNNKKEKNFNLLSEAINFTTVDFILIIVKGNRISIFFLKLLTLRPYQDIVYGIL